MPYENIQITKLDQASPADARVLSQISKASKAYWGYPAAWLELWREELEVSPRYLAQHHTFVLFHSSVRQYIGFCVIREGSDALLWVEHLWVLPDHIGKGLGSRLLRSALDACIRSTHQVVKVIADPNAAAFYGAMGFSPVGYQASQPGDRKLPIMERSLNR